MTPDPLADLLALEGVAAAYAGTRDGIDALLRDRGLRRTSPALTTESLLRGAVASATLAGSTSSAAEIRSGAGDSVARGAVRLSTELLGLVPVLSTAPLQAFARLHVLAGGSGRPAAADGAERLRGLAGVLATTSVPALVVAAVVHAEIATARPFGEYDALVARAAERLVLATRGVDEKSLTVPEAGHQALGATYGSNLRAYREGGASGVHAWLLYAAEAFTAGAEQSPLHKPKVKP